jgi:hypothetical protein
MSAFVPEQFSSPIVNPETATLFRRTPYVSPSEYNQAPTAVATNNLVPGGSASEQGAELVAVISRASDWVDTICFHRADGTLAASPTTDAGWITPRNNGSLALICNYKPILEVDALAVGPNASNMQNIGNTAAQNITIDGSIIWVQGCVFNAYANSGNILFAGVPYVKGKVYVVWIYVNGFPHNALADSVEEGAEAVTVSPSEPGGAKAYGVYPGTQLTIHDGANTEVIVVKEVEGLTFKLLGPLAYGHTVPPAPDSIRVSAVPWQVEQACISLTSALIKMRGTRAMVMPGVGGAPSKQALSQAGGSKDYDTACKLLSPFEVPFMRSSA